MLLVLLSPTRSGQTCLDLDHEEDVCILSVYMILLVVTSSFQAISFKIHKLTGHFIPSVKQPNGSVIGQRLTIFWDSVSELWISNDF